MGSVIYIIFREGLSVLTPLATIVGRVD